MYIILRGKVVKNPTQQCSVQCVARLRISSPCLPSVADTPPTASETRDLVVTLCCFPHARRIRQTDYSGQGRPCAGADLHRRQSTTVGVTGDQKSQTHKTQAATRQRIRKDCEFGSAVMKGNRLGIHQRNKNR
ncbi:hypothetical protein BaRGS_00009171 [Batillaria attramentaria]|uniref:Uncharacterized protein n=1 Tax=Batillaria attramentaria TaxID=370345 RepID=A0ABD0LJ13_9CAEN